MATRRTAGQNLVTDPNTVRRIVDAARLDPADVVLEIGPGLGSLTLGLAPVVRRVVAIELDAGFSAVLRDMFAGQASVEVVHGDAMTADLSELIGDDRVRLVANLPYNVATPLLFRSLATPGVEDVFVMVQREVGERWAARPGSDAYAGVSLKLALQAVVTVEFSVPRSVFLPVPNVDSVMVRVVRRDDRPAADDLRRLTALVDGVFSQRRKTLRNNLRRTFGSSANLVLVEERSGVDLQSRAETLDVDALVRLDAALELVRGEPRHDDPRRD